MKRFLLNSTSLRQRISVALAWCTLLTAPFAGAEPLLCQKTPAAKQDSLLVVDSAYRPIAGKALSIGDVDFSVSREVNRKYLVVAPPRANPQTSLGGAQMQSDLELLQKCSGKSVFALNLSFDSSTLGAGVFSEPLNIYQDGFGLKRAPLSASIEKVTGNIRRFWISAEIASRKQAAEDPIALRLTNIGNLKSAPLRFQPLLGVKSLLVARNECEARLLAPAESCVIEFTALPQRQADEVFEWPVDAGDGALLSLKFWRRNGAALAVEGYNR